MWIQVRRMDGKKTARIDGLSKLTKIEELREKLVDAFEATPDQQRLFYRGKQLEDGHTLFDYDVGLNEIVQLLIRAPVLEDKSQTKAQEIATSTEKAKEESFEDDSESSWEESTYKVGDIIDARDEDMGAWFEAKILKVSKIKPILNKDEPEKEKQNDSGEQSLSNADQNGNLHKDDDKENIVPSTSNIAPGSFDDGFSYQIQYDDDDNGAPVDLPATNIRPRAYRKVSLDQLKPGEKVMVNYNYDEPKTRGYWYDAIVKSVQLTRTKKELKATVHVGKDLIPMENCSILFVDEIFRIEERGTQCNVKDPDAMRNHEKRETKPECDHCKDNPKRKCKECSCHECGVKENPDKTLLCDECDVAYHIYCLKPPLQSIPDVDDWYCPLCKNDETEVVRAGEKLKQSKKKSKMASASNSGRDWGKGMACVGRTKKCNIVPQNHFGAIPGIEVGTLWKFRVQVSEAGVHRPHVAGIHGREEDGAYSIVLSGGYEDDEDNGEEFTYTGSGGRDLSGNKRTADQSSDQLLTRMNKALAKNCMAPLDSKKGGDAGDKWREGKPVRVVRNCKGAKHSQYAPEEGNRYDGIYKIVKFWPEKGKSGFKVWRYMLRRDDDTPAPWTKKGKERIENLGLEMQYPDGYLESQAQKQDEKEQANSAKKGKGKGKRKRSNSEDDTESASCDEKTPLAKKKRTYCLEKDVMDLIEQDKLNEKAWKDALTHRDEGSQKFLAAVEETFLCICCQDIVFKPVTTECKHNMCLNCLKRSFKAEVYNCSACRASIDKDFSMEINSTLQKILNKLFPGYEGGR